ncbi:SH3 domain-containing protein, partial [Streptomyces sp. T-3]|nr:SH3 domain-containing protein [Streptomyces sp. T-3]
MRVSHSEVMARACAGALVLGLTLGPCAAEAMPAAAHFYAEAGAPRPVSGEVISRIGQYVRSRPTVQSSRLGQYPSGGRVLIACKAKGQTVEGNSIWYRLADRNGWMSARYVRNLAWVRWCTQSGGGQAGEPGPRGPAGPAGPPGPAGP